MKKEFGIALLLVVVCVAMALITPNFTSPDNLFNLLKRIGFSGIFSIGLGIVIITGGIDLSVGSVFALQGIVLCMMLDEGRGSKPLAVAVSLAGVTVLGIIHGVLITRFKLQPFIVTLCGLMVYRGLARSVAHDDPKSLNSLVEQVNYGWLQSVTTGWLEVGRGYRIPSAFIILVIVSVIAWVLLHRSVYGRYLFAVGRNEEAARYSGVRTRLVIGSAYVISMILAGISGIILTFELKGTNASDAGVGAELTGIAAAVLGGCSLQGGEGSIIGIILGTAVLRVLLNAIILLNIPSTWELVVTGTVILIGVMFDQFLKTRKRVAVAKV